MKRVVVNTRRSPRGGKPQEAPVVLNGHLHGKPNGQGTLHRVEDAIRFSGCSAIGEFFRVARHVFPASATDEPFDMVSELSWFGAFANGNPVPEGYSIPECVRSLADKVLESKDRTKCFSLLRNSSDRKPRHAFSPGMEATQLS